MPFIGINDCASAFFNVCEHTTKFTNSVSYLKFIYTLNLHTGVTKRNGIHFTLYLKCINDCAYVFFSIHKNTTSFRYGNSCIKFIFSNITYRGN